MARDAHEAAAQERQIFRWINGHNPFQYGLDFGLWARQIVSTLIEREFGVRIGVSAIGALLAKLGLTAQKPLHYLIHVPTDHLRP